MYTPYVAIINEYNFIDINFSRRLNYNGSEYFKIKLDGKLELLEIVDVNQTDNQINYKCKIPDKFLYGKEYEVYTDRGIKTNLLVGSVVRTNEFDEEFYYDGNDLGYTYRKNETTFKLWSPIATSVKISILKNNSTYTYDLERQDKGIWSISIKEDLELASYVYLLKINGEWTEAIDPYAYTSTLNNQKSVVIDLESTKIDLNHDKKKGLDSYLDAIIYELHVRDFSMSDDSGIINKGKFLGVIEENTKTSNDTVTGLDYLKTLGITHIQFLPIYDFGSVDEENQLEFYNWGYDPVQFNVPEGSYASDILNPYSRIIDLKKMISKLHLEGFRVNMDVVYNHMYDMHSSAFHKIMPGYYFRYDGNGQISNGSFCGNDVESRSLMMRKYIVDSIIYWTKEFGIDGFRFDLMGIIDIDTINLIREELDIIDDSLMLYGEGWNMPSLMFDSEKASMFNWTKMPRVGFFNDRFRDTIKGKTSTDEAHKQGFIGGDMYYDVDAVHGLLGSIFDYEKAPRLFGNTINTINYIECHDNHTTWDKLKLSNANESEDLLRYRTRLGMALVLLSQGIPFIHAGQEFNRTKKGEHNSYNLDDSINMLDWNRKDLYIEDVNYLKGLIELRKSHKAFRFSDKQLIQKHVKVIKYSSGLIAYLFENVSEYGPFNEVITYINATNKTISADIKDEYRIIANDKHIDMNSNETIRNIVDINPISITVLVK